MPTWSASGRRGAVADDERAREVGRRHSSWEADEQSGAIRCGAIRGGAIQCGAGGAKGGGQGEYGPAQHAPDSASGKRVTSVGTDTASSKGKEQGKVHAALPPCQVRLLDEAFFELKEDAAAGVDGLTWEEYELNLEKNLEDLHARVHRGAYRALPSRRV